MRISARATRHNWENRFMNGPRRIWYLHSINWATPWALIEDWPDNTHASEVPAYCFHYKFDQAMGLPPNRTIRQNLVWDPETRFERHEALPSVREPYIKMGKSIVIHRQLIYRDRP